MYTWLFKRRSMLLRNLLTFFCLIFVTLSMVRSSFAQNLPAKHQTRVVHVTKKPSPKKITRVTVSVRKKISSKPIVTITQNKIAPSKVVTVITQQVRPVLRYGVQDEPATVGGRLVSYIRQTVSNLRYSSYKLGGTYFNVTKGVYIVDCSSYVDYILRAVYPPAYSNLATTTRVSQPTTQHYYNFFNNLSTRRNQYWNKVSDVKKLKPGDIVVFRNKVLTRQAAQGHIMVVMKKPVQRTNSFLVRVADSAPFRHSQDTRERNDSGIGVGNLLLKVNPQTGAPQAYAWTLSSRWKQNVNFAMGRLKELS